MAKGKIDAVVQAVHYNLDGQVAWVRAFQRRGPIFSDYVLLDRMELVEELRSKKKYVVGKRVSQMGGTFDTSTALQLIQDGDKEFLVSGDAQGDRDCLEGVPVI